MSEICLSEEKFACEKFAYVSNEICAWAKRGTPVKLNVKAVLRGRVRRE